jgi:(+)-pinoresinol hydroxylase
MMAPRGEELLALTGTTAKVYADMGLTPPFVGGWIYHRRGRIVFHPVSTYRTADDNKKTRTLFERLVTACAEGGWNTYRIHASFQELAIRTYGFNNGSPHRLHETLKDAIDPNGILSAGRYDIWPKHLREKGA